MVRLRRGAAAVAGVALALGAAGLFLGAAKTRVTVARDDAQGRLAVLIGGREALVFKYGPEVDIPHYWPLRSPSGRNMLVEKTEPYPHHRSFWFADTVRTAAAGERDLSFYNALYSGVKTETGDYAPPFRERIRLESFPRLETKKSGAVIEARLVWESDGRPVLRERRQMDVRSLGGGEYLLDLAWSLTPAEGAVTFASDDVHYAWPFLRLDTPWNGEHGGAIVSDSGAAGEKATNMKPALWIDYSNTVDGVTEGVAVFQWPDGREHRWLTREYGCFGPRRPDDRSGKPFTLEPGESLTQRAGVLVHRGDVRAGRVRERYEKYVEAARTPPVSRMSIVEGDDVPEAGLLPPSPGPRRAGTLTVLDGGRKVLTYVYGDQLPPGVEPRFARSSYIHPLYDLDGRVLTEDFPRDHFHHHGLFWAWPEVRVRGVGTSNWEPGDPPLRERFVKWVERSVDDAGARLVVENAWTLAGAGDVAEETVAIVVHGAARLGRAIDVEIALRPVGGPIALGGAPEDRKGYSGLCFRGRATEGRDISLFKGAAMTTDEGPLEADSTGRPFRWADLSVPGRGGVAVFVSPRHPGFPLPWLIRNSYAGILNPCWPGLEGAVLPADVPVLLRYRLYVHNGDAASGRVARAYAAYLASETK